MKKYILICCTLLSMLCLLGCTEQIKEIPKDYELVGTITTNKDFKRVEIIVQSFSSKIKEGDIYIKRNDDKILSSRDFTDKQYKTKKGDINISSYFAFIYDKDNIYNYQIYANPKINCDTVDAILWKPKKGNKYTKFTLENVGKDKFNIVN